MLVEIDTVLGMPATTWAEDCVTVILITAILYQIEESRILVDHLFLQHHAIDFMSGSAENPG
jgi:hypothetical protein